MKQTYIINTWSGGTDYIGAKHYNFYRLGCKKVETCKNYLRNWVAQARSNGWENLYKDLCNSDAQYSIIATPNGYDGKEIVAKGFIKDLF